MLLKRSCAPIHFLNVPHKSKKKFSLRNSHKDSSKRESAGANSGDHYSSRSKGRFLIVDLLLINRWSSVFLIPYQFVLLVKTRRLVGHWNDLAAVPAFLPADTHGVSRDPENRRRRGDCGVIVSVTLGERVVDNLRESTWHKTTQSLIIGVYFGMKPFGDEVGFFVRCRR